MNCTNRSIDTEKKLIVFDMDSTLIDAETIDELAKISGVLDEVSRITEDAMEGKIDYSQALKERVKLLKGLELEDAKRAVRDMPIMTGARELIKHVKSAGYITAMLSGGFRLAADDVGEMLGIDHIFANELVVRDGKLTGEVRGPLTTQNSKEKMLEQIAFANNMAPDECIVVGDGANDICIFKRAKYAIAFNPKPILRPYADVVIIKKDLRAVIPVIKAIDTGVELRIVH
ncbi:phosphoserine phosphatase SerB [Methanosalsum zhilinae DSM 4017]|uniref:phosphoserine phosphatase n=1 Tax=Methanosalsum zhilinae (strain DSM 4017 / NBRC 107636 / OCM 62 / WeN5) TaxID=679901 RepID=F7XNL8_METZD|nr:phosphoserine phosphatase SerB [Methanosalsum zhilinae DSM 4017]